MRLNLGEDAPLPHLALRVEEPEDLAALADQAVRLAQSGLTIPQRWLREKFGTPEPAGGEAAIGGAGGEPAPPSAQSRVLALHETRGSAQAGELLARLADALRDIPVDRLRDALASAQFAARLAGVHGLDPAREA